jgi:hypothetical protein
MGEMGAGAEAPAIRIQASLNPQYRILFTQPERFAWRGKLSQMTGSNPLGLSSYRFLMLSDVLAVITS